jgi:tRNA-specific 2-thiouridylase
VRLRAVNWIGPGFIEEHARGEEILVQIRSSRAPVRGFLVVSAGETVVEFAVPEDAVSPGQACVFYAPGEPCARVLGGGYIVSAEPVFQAAIETGSSHRAPLPL